MKSDLTLVSTDDLLDELSNRHDALVVSAVKFMNTKSDYVVLRRNSGNRFVCLGLLDTLKSTIVDQELNSQFKVSNNDKGDI